MYFPFHCKKYLEWLKEQISCNRSEKKYQEQYKYKGTIIPERKSTHRNAGHRVPCH